MEAGRLAYATRCLTDLFCWPSWARKRRTHGNVTARKERSAMPIATPEVYAEMIDAAKKGSFAYPAINVSLHRL